jgi:hypothetical protein
MTRKVTSTTSSVMEKFTHENSMSIAYTTLPCNPHTRCVGLLLLTGTPMKNGKPSNLFPLLKAVRHPLGRNQKAYETHFCNGGLKNFGKGSVWDATGCSNLAQLQQLVASNLLHMTKEQCLSDLPPLANISHHVPVSSRFQIQYERCVKDLVRYEFGFSRCVLLWLAYFPLS